jgi:GNAT superfamily N-acetyltransferase
MSPMIQNYAPLTLENWGDFEALFGTRGACGGCWCMAWRRERAVFNQQKGAGNKAALRKRLAAGNAPGILLYRDGRAIGWCSVAPREEFVALARSRVWKPVDEQPVWSVSCFFVAKEYRNQGVSVELLRAATEFARQQGAKIVEGYPQELRGKKLPPPFVWTGLASAFQQAGFQEVARRSPNKPIMRYVIA